VKQRPDSRHASRGDGQAHATCRWLPSVLTGVAALAAYLAIMPDAAGDKDAAEFMLVLATGGVAHPTGYPLYTLFGHPFVLLLHALGAGWAWAANAWSALGGAVAVMLLHRLACRLAAGAGAAPRAATWLAWVPAVLFGLDPVWTYETTLAETGSWHVAWAAGAVLLCLRLRERMATVAEPSGADWRRGALAWGAVCGAGLAHHLTALLLIAPLTAALLWTLGGRRPRPHVLAWGAVGLLPPLLSYAFIAWRAFHPGEVQWSVLAPSWRSVLDHLTAAQYGDHAGRFAPSGGQARNLARYVYPLVAVAALALTLAIRAAGRGPRRDVLLAVAAGCLLQLAVIFGYGVPDPSSYFLPVLALGLAAVAPAVAGLGGVNIGGATLGGGGRGGTRHHVTARPGPAVLLTAAIAAAVLGLLAVSWLRVGVERRDLYVRHERMLRQMWESVTIDQAFVLWNDDMVHRLRAWQVLDGQKPGLVVINPAMLTHAWPREQFRRAHGFDPVAGPTAGGSDSERAARINEQSPLPVIEFEMKGPSVRMLRKAVADSTVLEF